MEKSIFAQCLKDTGIAELLTGLIGEDASLQTQARMYEEFEKSAQASRDGDQEFNARIAEARLLTGNVFDPAKTGYYSECYKKLFGLQRVLRSYSRLIDSGEKKLWLLQVARTLLEACDTVAAKDFDYVPETTALELRAMNDFPQKHSRTLAEIRKKLSYIRAELGSLPLIKLRFNVDGDSASGCTLEMTGKASGTSGIAHSSSLELPAELAGRLEYFRPELFSSIEEFCGQRENEVIGLSTEFSDFSQTLGYLLNLEKLYGLLRRNNFPLCHPRPSRRTTDLINVCHVTELLLRKNNLNRQIVTNNLTLHRKDMMTLISGPVGSGKTSYLKAVAIANLFFMIGMPVAAAMGSMVPVNGIYICPKGYDPEIIPENGDLDGSIVLILWPDSKETSREELDQVVAKLTELSNKGAHGIIAVRAFSGHGNNDTISDIVPDNVPLMDPIIGRDGKCTYRFKTVHRGDDSKATDIISRYGLDKSDLLLRFRSRNR